jgi:hypothetical protein
VANFEDFFGIFFSQQTFFWLGQIWGASLELFSKHIFFHWGWTWGFFKKNSTHVFTLRQMGGTSLDFFLFTIWFL